MVFAAKNEAGNVWFDKYVECCSVANANDASPVFGGK